MRYSYNGRKNEDVVNRRREIVSDYMAKGIEDYTSISQAWALEGITTPDGEPYCEVTLSQDKKRVRSEWAKYANENYDLLVGDTVKRQKEVFKEAMKAGDYSSALNALKGIRELLDIDKPKGSRAIKNAADERLIMTGKGGMTNAESERQAAQLENTPAVFGEMLQIMRETGVISAALLTEEQQIQNAKTMLENSSENDLLPAGNNGLQITQTGNGNNTENVNRTERKWR